MKLDDFEEKLAALSHEIAWLRRQVCEQESEVEVLDAKYHELYREYINLNNRLTEVPIGAWDEPSWNE